MPDPFDGLPAAPPLPADWPPLSPAAEVLRRVHYASYQPRLNRSPIDPSDTWYGGYDFELAARLMRVSGWTWRGPLSPSRRRSEVMETAAALGTFTAGELCAYTTADPDTVRRILRESNDFVSLGQLRPGGRGRPPAMWRMTDEARHRVLSSLEADDEG